MIKLRTGIAKNIFVIDNKIHVLIQCFSNHIKAIEVLETRKCNHLQFFFASSKSSKIKHNKNLHHVEYTPGLLSRHITVFRPKFKRYLPLKVKHHKLSPSPTCNTGRVCYHCDPHCQTQSEYDA